MTLKLLTLSDTQCECYDKLSCEIIHFTRVMWLDEDNTKKNL